MDKFLFAWISLIVAAVVGAWLTFFGGWNSILSLGRVAKESLEDYREDNAQTGGRRMRRSRRHK
jgi:hypothetical protein